MKTTTNLTRSLFILLSLLCATALAQEPNESPLVGSWGGPLVIGEDDLGLVFNFSIEDGEYSATMISDAMGTLAEKLEDKEEARLPQVVKLVVDAESRALYFSRSLIPYPRSARGPVLLRHIGIYGFQADFLQRFPALEKSPLEEAEGLEQLRTLYHGYKIRVGVVEGQGVRGIDTRDDYDAFLLRYQKTTADS